MNYTAAFNRLHPDFFHQESIRTMPKDWIFTELVMNLHTDLPDAELPCPEGITFGEYHGKLSALREAVRRVDEDWAEYFTEGNRFYCAFEGETIAAFCILDDMGEFSGLRIGAPGCVGTVPQFRRQGIGLKTVYLATRLLREEGFDLSWIHYTHLAHWYSKIGYQPVLHWNRCGILPDAGNS